MSNMDTGSEKMCEMSSARIVFDCPACDNRLGLEPPAFRITLGSAGATASPEWACPCGIRGRIFRGKRQVLGRISIPPSRFIRAGRDPAVREAITFSKPEVDAPVEVEVDAGEEDDGPCDERLRHGVFSRKGIRCPICFRPPGGFKDEEE